MSTKPDQSLRRLGEVVGNLGISWSVRKSPCLLAWEIIAPAGYMRGPGD